MAQLPQLKSAILKALQEGQVIPAHPLALNSARQFDEQHQRALTRYYLNAGAGGIAVGVHTTQFEIRKRRIGLYQPVLELASEEVDNFIKIKKKPIIKIAGVVGLTSSAVREAQLAADLGYHAALLSLSAFHYVDNTILLTHCQQVAKVMPLVGFYLQPSVGGRILDRDFWRGFAEIENVVAIKIAPFNQYHTIDVMYGVAQSGRAKEIALYTGNDDHIVLDLMTPFHVPTATGTVNLQMVGGLLGHWAVWTRQAVRLLDKIKKWRAGESKLTNELLALAPRITDCNGAFFDVQNDFRGCIVGLHYVLQRQGLLDGIWTLHKAITLDEKQRKQIERAYHMHPDLNDDDFVEQYRDQWLR
jgi:dihydrodipicolinate synthase/N-acetylneuraminate lyase